MSTSTTPPDAPLAITMGDACGIGPEIIVKAHMLGAAADAVVYGDAEVLAMAAAQLPGARQHLGAAVDHAVGGRRSREGLDDDLRADSGGVAHGDRDGALVGVDGHAGLSTSMK